MHVPGRSASRGSAGHQAMKRGAGMKLGLTASLAAPAVRSEAVPLSRLSSTKTMNEPASDVLVLSQPRYAL